MSFQNGVETGNGTNTDICAVTMHALKIGQLTGDLTRNGANNQPGRAPVEFFFGRTICG